MLVNQYSQGIKKTNHSKKRTPGRSGVVFLYVWKEMNLFKYCDKEDNREGENKEELLCDKIYFHLEGEGMLSHLWPCP